MTVFPVGLQRRAPTRTKTSATVKRGPHAMAVKGALGAAVDLGALGAAVDPVAVRAIHDTLSLLIVSHQDPTGCCPPQGQLWTQPWSRKCPGGKRIHVGIENFFFIIQPQSTVPGGRYLHVLTTNPPASLSRNPLPSATRALGCGRGVATCRHYSTKR